MSKLKVAVVFGGKSSEYSVSLHSASSAIRHLNPNKYEILYIGISEQGDWYLFEGSVDEIEHDKWLSGKVTPVTISLGKDKGLVKLSDNGTYELINFDCILPILHGVNGEDGTLQGLLELCNIKYVGCDHLCSANSMDKEITHIICEHAGIKMAPYLSVTNFKNLDYHQIIEQAKNKLTLPVFVKPANAGSSYGITKVEDFAQLKEAILFGFKYDKKVIIETGIDGFEVGCAVLGNDYDNLLVGEVDEIDTNNNFFDFEAKYALENTEIVCPARISKAKSDEIKNNAKKIYQAMQCSGLARIDMFVDSKEEVYFNELNTIPGMTATSRYPSMMKAINIEFDELLDRLIDCAMNK